jgi:hypothetical protein
MPGNSPCERGGCVKLSACKIGREKYRLCLVILHVNEAGLSNWLRVKLAREKDRLCLVIVHVNEA